VALAIFQACITQPGYAAETNAVIPYKTLDDLCQFMASVNPAKLEVHVTLYSINKAVRPADIRLSIQSAIRGRIPVLVGTNGQILAFPHEPDLIRENPSISANQPKGTLGLAVSTRIPLPDARAFRYSRLGDGIAEANKVIKAQAGMLSVLAPKAQGVIFFFPKQSAGRAKVEIASSARHLQYTADAKGEVKLKWDKALLAENPEVRVSEKPQAIVPDVE
jgi:hypothetical protein